MEGGGRRGSSVRAGFNALQSHTPVIRCFASSPMNHTFLPQISAFENWSVLKVQFVKFGLCVLNS